jgi:hypothetical protein
MTSRQPKIDADHVRWAADLAQAIANDLTRRAKASAARKTRR